MPIVISKVTNANVYVDGTVDLIGRAKEVKLPEVTTKVIEHTALGMFGTLELPSGLEKLNVTFKWGGFYGDLVQFGGNPFKAHKLQIRANHETYDADGRTLEQPLVILVTGSWKKMALGTVKAQEQLEGDDELSCTYLKITLGGVELLEVDVLQNIWKVGGVDILEQWKASLSG